MDSTDVMMGLTLDDERSIIGYYKSKNIKSSDELYALETVLVANMKAFPNLIKKVFYVIFSIAILLSLIKNVFVVAPLWIVVIFYFIYMKFFVQRKFEKKVKMFNRVSDKFRRDNGFT